MQTCDGRLSVLLVTIATPAAAVTLSAAAPMPGLGSERVGGRGGGDSCLTGSCCSALFFAVVSRSSLIGCLSSLFIGLLLEGGGVSVLAPVFFLSTSSAFVCVSVIALLFYFVSVVINYCCRCTAAGLGFTSAAAVVVV